MHSTAFSWAVLNIKCLHFSTLSINLFFYKLKLLVTNNKNTFLSAMNSYLRSDVKLSSLYTDKLKWFLKISLISMQLS